MTTTEADVITELVDTISRDAETFAALSKLLTQRAKEVNQELQTAKDKLNQC